MNFMKVDFITGGSSIISSDDDDDFDSLAMELQTPRQIRIGSVVGDGSNNSRGLVRLRSRRPTRENEEFSMDRQMGIMLRSGSRRATRDGEGELPGGIGAPPVRPNLSQLSMRRDSARAGEVDVPKGVKDRVAGGDDGQVAPQGVFRRSSLVSEPDSRASSQAQAEPFSLADNGAPSQVAAVRKQRRSSWLDRAWVTMTEQTATLRQRPWRLTDSEPHLACTTASNSPEGPHGRQEQGDGRRPNSLVPAGYKQEADSMTHEMGDYLGGGDEAVGGQKPGGYLLDAHVYQTANIPSLNYMRSRRHSSALSHLIPSTRIESNEATASGMVGVSITTKRSSSMPGEDMMLELFVQQAPSSSAGPGRAHTSRRRRMSLPGPPCLDPVSGLPIATTDNGDEALPEMVKSLSVASSSVDRHQDILLSTGRQPLVTAASDLISEASRAHALQARNREVLGLMMKADASMAGIASLLSTYTGVPPLTAAAAAAAAGVQPSPSKGLISQVRVRVQSCSSCMFNLK